MATITTESLDGKVVKCHAEYFSCFKDMEAASMSACGAKGKATGSEVNMQAIEATASGVARGLAGK